VASSVLVAFPENRAVGPLEGAAYRRSQLLCQTAYPAGLPTGDDPAAWQRASAHPAGYWYDPAAAARPGEFIEGYCRHHKGEWSGQLLRLEPWELFPARQVFGWKRADGSRLYRVAYIEVARKNGKTEVAGAVGLYLTVGDGEPGAEVYSAATKRDQAKIAHDVARAMVSQDAALRRYVKLYRNNLSCDRLHSKFEPLSADSQTLDGLNPHGAIIDELHAHKNRGVYDVLDTAMGSRRQPLIWIITTAGVYEPESIGWELHAHGRAVLEGSLDDDEFFAFICAATAEDDWTDPRTWEKANPNLGVSVKRDYLEKQCRAAQQRPGFLNTFLRLHLNIWTEQVERWIPVEKWNECDPGYRAGVATDREAYRAWRRGFAGRPCFGALDLSTKIDVTALSLVFPPWEEDEHWTVLPWFWVPKERLLQRARRDRVPYDLWARAGWLTATRGETIDYGAIRRHLTRLREIYDIQELAYDPWNATQFAGELEDDGFTMVEMRQGFATLNEPSKEFERLVYDHSWRHGGHPVLRWMVGNAAKREDPAGNIKPDKKASGDRIDGVITTIMATGRAAVVGVSTGLGVSVI